MDCYRPIALLTIFTKIFEKYLHRELYSFLETKNIITREQNGFRKNRNTNMAIYDFLDIVMNNVDNKTPTCAIYMDMTQAFDCVDHQILLDKLDAYGIRGILNKLIKSYLENRKQYVEVSRIDIKSKQEVTYTSHVRTLKFGVPQGSILGPLLFLIYINDLPKAIDHPMTLFADDSTVVMECKGDVTQYENDINGTLINIISWLKNNNLTVNIEKTKIMHFSQRIATPELNIQYQGVKVEEVASTKFLGVYIDKALTWKTHIEHISKKLSKSAFALYKLAQIVNTEAVLTAYHGLVASILRYGILFWGNSTEQNKVLLLQKRCIRAMFGLKTTDSCRPFFVKYGILTSISLFIFEVSVFVKTNPDLFKQVGCMHDRNLRNRDRLCVRQTQTKLMAKSVLAMAPKIFNKLPRDIKALNTNLFKQRLNLILRQKCYYTLNDFLKDKL